MSTRVIENLRYLIESAWTGGSGVAKAEKDIRGLGDTTEKVKERGQAAWKTMGKAVVGFGAVAGGVAIAGRELYQVIGEGAELVAAEDKFNNLAASINSTGDAMMGSLRNATQGMVSDAELVESATQIMSLGLQDTEEGVTRLATVAGNLGWDMQQVIMTMANDSVMRLDALGLSIEDVQARAKVLEDQGLDASKAFDLAVIEAGEAKYELLGDRLDTTAGQMQLFETSIKNAQDEFKIGLVEGFSDGLGDTATQAAQAAADIAILTNAVGGFLGKIGGGTLGNLGRQLSANEITDTAVALGLMSDEYSKILLQDLKRGAPGASESLELYTQRVENFRAESDALTDSWGRAKSASGTYANEIQHIEQVTSTATTKQMEWRDILAVTNPQLEASASYTNDMAWAAAELGVKADGTRIILEQGIGLQKIGQDAEYARLSVLGLNEELDRLSGRHVEAGIGLDLSDSYGNKIAREGMENYTGDYGYDPGGGDYVAPSFTAPAPAPFSPPPQIPESSTSAKGGGVTVVNNNYNEQATAIAMAMQDQLLLQRIDQLMVG